VKALITKAISENVSHGTTKCCGGLESYFKYVDRHVGSGVASGGGQRGGLSPPLGPGCIGLPQAPPQYFQRFTSWAPPQTILPPPFFCHPTPLHTGSILMNNQEKGRARIETLVA